MSIVNNKKKLIFIVNPISGGSKYIDISTHLESRIDRNKFVYEIHLTEYEGHAAEICMDSIKKAADIIIAVGGDGTINEVASQMINSDCVLGIIPRGSGNGLARHLGIPLSVNKAIDLINSQKIIKIDTASVNDKIFISIAGVGFDAHIADLFAGSTKRGFFSYFKLVATNYNNYKPKKYKIKLDSKDEITSTALFITFANSNQFGYNTTIAPNAKLNDGKLDICIVNKPSIFEIPIIVNLLLLKKIHLSPHVKIIPASEITITQSENRTANIDGEPIKLGKELKIKVNPLSLNVIIP